MRSTKARDQDQGAKQLAPDTVQQTTGALHDTKHLIRKYRHI
jgi:hypothetical protein